MQESIKELQKWLSKKYIPRKKAKAIPFTKKEISDFQELIAIPTLDQIKEELCKYSFTKITLTNSVYKTKIRISEYRTHFEFCIDVSSTDRSVSLRTTIAYPTGYNTSSQSGKAGFLVTNISTLQEFDPALIVTKFTEEFIGRDAYIAESKRRDEQYEKEMNE